MTLLERIRASGTRPVVLIDGRSGAGKSTLATSLVDHWPAAQLVRLEDIYPGWDGLELGSSAVAERLLATSDPHWFRWDWTANRPAERHSLDGARPMIIDGAGALSRANRSLATYAIWVERDDGERRAAALARDGDTYAPHWERWAAQEAAFIAREHPRSLADEVVFR